MIIPNKHSGYQAGIRLYPVDGGGGGGGAFAQPMTGADYNRRLQAGETSQAIRDSQRGGLFGAGQGLSDNQFNDIVTQAGMQSPTGRPLAGSAQFFQPVRQTQYQNYANPYTAFNVSTYGTQPMQSPISASGASRENINSAVGSYIQNNPNADMNTMAAALRGSGMNPYDVQGAAGFNNYGPQMSMPQMQQPFNPFTNSFGGGFGGGFMPQRQQQFQQPMQQFQQPMQQQFAPQMQQPMPQTFTPQRSASTPARSFVSRSSQMRGTPNVMRRAQGGITALLDKK